MTMQRLRPIVVLAIALAAFPILVGKSESGGEKKAGKGKSGSETELVNKINEIVLEPGAGCPPVHYLIKAKGSVLRKGYTNPVLIIKSTAPDAQGNLTYYFAADPPIGGTDMGPIEIKAERYLFDLQNVKKITVISATNELSKLLP